MVPDVIVAIITVAGTLITVAGGIIVAYLQLKGKDRETKTDTLNIPDQPEPLPPASQPMLPEYSSQISPGQKFSLWDGLSDTVVIVYGAKYHQVRDKDGHLSLSLRDLTAAQSIHDHLTRRYPHKNFVLMPALSNSWQSLLRENTDLIIVGGFVVNDELTQNRSLYQQKLRLKMGRLCHIEGRHVYHVEPIREILRNQPHKIEELSSALITKDFALVSRTRRNIYGASRNIITLAGIKGHGTLGAANFLTSGTSSYTFAPVSPGKRTDLRLELILKTEVKNNRIVTTEIVEALVDGMPTKLIPGEQPAEFLLLAEANIEDQAIKKQENPLLWQDCELNEKTNPCDKCTFGEILPRYQFDLSLITNRLNLQGIIFDLDDTLIDTFSMLITPLEEKAAREIARLNASQPIHEHLDKILLELRKREPIQIENVLGEQFSLKTDALIKRQAVIGNLKGIKLDRLAMRPEVYIFLRELKEKYKLFLLTEGNEDFQNRKIDHLGIRDLFREIRITSTAEDSKERIIEDLIKEYENDQLKSNSLLIVGNRLDKEIRAGNNLGIRTIWLRHGEGSNPSSDSQNGVPDYIVDDILEIKKVLEDIVQP
jgi:FMN phosphatase YigB (HAD superfamily)